MKKGKALNTFSEGMVLDLHPLSVSNKALTGCLNGTLLTYNGNENMLQNDMGNGRVETAYLPEGYIPVGTCELGGIVYIASYNPLTKQSQLGSFPSPERNIDSKELGDSEVSISIPEINPDTVLEWYQKQNILTEKVLHSGDQFKVCSPDIANYKKYISNYRVYGDNYVKRPKYLKFDVAVIDSENNIQYFTNDLLDIKDKETTDKYYIYRGSPKGQGGVSIDYDDYNDAVTSNYDVIQNTTGKLAIIAKYEIINSLDVSYELIQTNNDKENPIYKLYLLVNWANPDNENRINPKNLCLVYNGDTDIKTGENKNYITLPIHAKNTKNELAYYDALINADYYQTEYQQGSIANYLKKGNKFTSNLRKNDGSDPKTIIDTGISIAKTANGYLVYRKTIRQIGVFEKVDRDNVVVPKEKNNKAIKNSDIQNRPSEILKYEYTELSTVNEIFNFSVYAQMPFGILGSLKKDFSINLARVNSGDFNLVEYKYYVDSNNNNVIFNLQIESYPNESRRIVKTELNFVDCSKVPYLNKLSSNIDDAFYTFKQGREAAESWQTKFKEHLILERNGAYKKEEEITTQTIPSNYYCSYQSLTSNFSINLVDTESGLKKDKIYLLQICLAIGTDENNYPEYQTYYRFVFTSGIFNQYYTTDVNFVDFSNILLYDIKKTKNPLTIDLVAPVKYTITNDKIYYDQSFKNISPIKELSTFKEEKYEIAYAKSTITYQDAAIPEINTNDEYIKFTIDSEEDITTEHQLSTIEIQSLEDTIEEKWNNPNTDNKYSEIIETDEKVIIDKNTFYIPILYKKDEPKSVKVYKLQQANMSQLPLGLNSSSYGKEGAKLIISKGDSIVSTIPKNGNQFDEKTAVFDYRNFEPYLTDLLQNADICPVCLTVSSNVDYMDSGFTIGSADGEKFDGDHTLDYCLYNDTKWGMIESASVRNQNSTRQAWIAAVRNSDNNDNRQCTFIRTTNRNGLWKSQKEGVSVLYGGITNVYKYDKNPKDENFYKSGTFQYLDDFKIKLTNEISIKKGSYNIPYIQTNENNQEIQKQCIFTPNTLYPKNLRVQFDILSKSDSIDIPINTRWIAEDLMNLTFSDPYMYVDTSNTYLVPYTKDYYDGVFYVLSLDKFLSTNVDFSIMPDTAEIKIKNLHSGKSLRLDKNNTNNFIVNGTGYVEEEKMDKTGHNLKAYFCGDFEVSFKNHHYRKSGPFYIECTALAPYSINPQPMWSSPKPKMVFEKSDYLTLNNNHYIQCKTGQWDTIHDICSKTMALGCSWEDVHAGIRPAETESNFPNCPYVVETMARQHSIIAFNHNHD